MKAIVKVNFTSTKANTQANVTKANTKNENIKEEITMKETTNTNAKAQETTNKEEVTMSATTRKSITDEIGKFNIDYMKEIRKNNSARVEAEAQLTKTKTEANLLLKEILKEYENYIGGKTYWFSSDEEKYFGKIKSYNNKLDKIKDLEKIIKEAKAKLSEYDY